MQVEWNVRRSVYVDATQTFAFAIVHFDEDNIVERPAIRESDSSGGRREPARTSIMNGWVCG